MGKEVNDVKKKLVALAIAALLALTTVGSAAAGNPHAGNSKNCPISCSNSPLKK
jgi:hypothetical protein